MTEQKAQEYLDNQTAVHNARTEFHGAIEACERQAEHARDAIYKENLNQALLHFETGASACDRAIRAKAALDKALRRVANAVPYA